MSDPFTIQRFLPYVGEVFRVAVDDDGELPVLLTEITRLVTDGSPRRNREPFSLVFHAGPGSSLEQRVYRVHSAGMEPFDCFLVPIGPDGNGMRLEAIYT